ncbi:sulfurtransferase complex subunit TusD [Neptunomonas sp.]|uniref:sulfurtransferase complex subunit TusD n=1 Tax=Neptunomonas sp. TaxID=1971898 RepID=UPI00356B4BE6
MIFSILIYGSAHNSQSVHSAYRFTDSVLRSGHQIHRVFFYGESVHAASILSAPPRDELNIHQLWKDLAETHQIDIVVCIAAALKRGVMNEAEARRHEKENFNTQAPFELSGLGQLSEAAIISDRLVTFGA